VSPTDLQRPVKQDPEAVWIVDLPYWLLTQLVLYGWQQLLHLVHHPQRVAILRATAASAVLITLVSLPLVPLLTRGDPAMAATAAQARTLTASNSAAPKQAAAAKPAASRSQARRAMTLVVKVDGLNVRSKPTTVGNRPVSYLEYGTKVKITKVVDSQDPYHTRQRQWGQTNGGRWVWMGGLAVKLPKQAATHKAASAAAGSNSKSRLRAYARQLLAKHGWAGQFDEFEYIVDNESDWIVNVSNGGARYYIPGRAYGIPQALPGSKMASAGADWRTNGRTQLRWMVSYIAERYGSLHHAYLWKVQHGWY
jgi:hypothetical protein